VTGLADPGHTPDRSRPISDLARHWDLNRGGSIAIPATYLEIILTLR